MKKTLKRLKETAVNDLEQCTKTFRELLERKSKMPEGEQSLYNVLFEVSFSSMKSLLSYLNALEDYSGELGEKWDDLLKSIEQTQQSKQDKQNKEKASYRV